MRERIEPARISANQRSNVSRISDFVRVANSISAIPLMAAVEREIYLREQRDEHHDDGDANSPSPSNSRAADLTSLDPTKHIHRLRRFHRLRNNGMSRTEPASDHDAHAHSGLSGLLSLLGRHDEAIAEDRRARELDPVGVLINTVVGRTLHYARRVRRGD